MSTDNETIKSAAEIAEFRFGIIAPAIQGLYPDASEAAYFRRIAEKPLTLPNGMVRKFSYKTFQDWATRYKKDGLDALMPLARSDKGATRALPDTAIEEIYRLKQEFPRMNATQIYASLVRDKFIPASVSVDSVQRFVKQHDLKYSQNPSMRDRKAFEEDAFGKMWQADTCYICHIEEGGRSRQVYCMAIIDDHSRMLVGAELFYHDNAVNFQKVLKDAVSTFGVPSKLLVDNGAPYANEQLSMICVSLGIALIHTRVRDGASKAKIERQWGSLKSRWLYNLKPNGITSLEQFNTMLKDYVRSYNTTFHTGIGMTPMERFQATADEIRKPASTEWIEECFYNRVRRKVRKDATVSISNISYDVPMQFIGMNVEIRFIPDKMESAFILYEGTKSPIHRTNKVENCHTKRNNPTTLDYSKVGER